MKKKIAALLALILCLSCLTGCHGSKGMDAFEIPQEFDTSKDYEIVFWAKNDTNITQANIYKQAIEDFQALYPNIHVTMRAYNDYVKIYNDVITNISTGTTPNVCITYPDHIATYKTGTNVVVELDELLTDEKFGLAGSQLRFESPSADEIIPQFLSECEIEGVHYALPYMRSTEALYINASYVKKLGYSIPEQISWDWIWEVSEAAMKQNADGSFALNGQNVLIPFIYKSTDNMMIQMLRQKGAGYAADDGTIEIFNDTTKELLFEIAKHGESRAFSTFKISSYPANFLNAGQCIFAIDSTAGATWMGPKAPLSDISAEDFVDFDIEVRAIPQFDADNPQMISQGPSVCIFNKADPQEVLASWLFAQFLLTDKVQTAYAQTEGYVPVTASAQESPEYKDYLSRKGEDYNEHYWVKIAASELLLENKENTFITPVFNGSASLRNAAGQMIEEAAYSARRKKTVDDAFIEDLYDNMNSLYRLDQLGGASSSDENLSPLPKEAKILLGSLAGAWILIVAWFAFSKLRNK